MLASAAELRQQSAETSKAAVGGSLAAWTEVVNDLRQHPGEVACGLLVRDAELGREVADGTGQRLAYLVGTDGLVGLVVDPRLRHAAETSALEA